MSDKKYSRFTTTHKVRPDDIDMFNHVHNSIYLDYVLAARYEQMERFYGMAIEKFLEMGFGWVVKAVQIDFKRALSLGDHFSVETGIIEINKKGCRVTFEINNLKTGKTTTTGWFDFVMIDLKTGKSLLLSDEMIRVYTV